MKKRLLIFLMVMLCAFALGACDFDIFESGDGNGGGNSGNEDILGGRTYEVGVDIEAGEYLMIPSSLGYFQVTLTKDAAITSSDFLYNGNTNGRRYIMLNDGEFLKVTGIKLYELDNAPAITKESDNGYKSGQYKVGRDISAGEYIIVDSTFGSLNYVEQLLSPNAKPGSGDFLFNKTFGYRQYVMAEDGQYISLNAGKLYAAADAPAIVKNSNDSIKAGQYKVGSDIDAGTYNLIVTAGKNASYTITTLPLCNPGSSAFIKIEIIKSDKEITLSDGQYITLSGCSLESAA